ncbi:acetoin utilization protein AcuC [Thermasporomyces composti]|uniref:Acetoin utilization protein AcuC n=1 Tax=Thermasporomyces composti TaxID=696763 RepID=A0A3D9V6Y5_THECX|nr:acetoin utilization protein AcuC [Thermasporomyces composti]REF37076.1 acetoin utilization protein AcuC [Thermasporomyces composti]
MTELGRLVYDEGLTAYDFGPGHPLAPIRVRLTVALTRELGLIRDGERERSDEHVVALDGCGLEGLTMVPAPRASDDVLATIHDHAYIEAVQRASADPRLIDVTFGLGTPDNPTFAGMHEAAARVVGASIEAARSVWEGTSLHAANIAGGLHHAMPAMASGFCVYNDPAAAIRWLLDAGCPRVAYIDLDVHHGDGVQEIFYDDPRVLTISLHESPRTLFPYRTGFPSETGGPGAEGTAVNIALPRGTGDEGWLRAFHAMVPALVEAFQPAVIVSQHGCDSHRLDPLAHLNLSIDAQRAAAAAVHELSHRVAEGRWVVTGGGGYALVDVVPRIWSHLLAIVGGQAIRPETTTPLAWRQFVADECGRSAPEAMTDGAHASYAEWSAGYDPADPVDRAIRATRRAVFPAHGLDPD